MIAENSRYNKLKFFCDPCVVCKTFFFPCVVNLIKPLITGIRDSGEVTLYERSPNISHAHNLEQFLLEIVVLKLESPASPAPDKNVRHGTTAIDDLRDCVQNASKESLRNHAEAMKLSAHLALLNDRPSISSRR